MEVPDSRQRGHAVHPVHLGWRNENNRRGRCRCLVEVRAKYMRVASRNEVSQVQRAEMRTIGLD